MTFAPYAGSSQRVLVTQGLRTPEAWVGRLAEALRPVTVDVVPVRTLSGAMERLSSLRPRVVVLDEPTLVDMGWSLLRQIRRLEADVACLMVVNRAEPVLLSRALQLSAYSVFEAPVDVDMMRQMVCRLLQRADHRWQ